MARKIALLSADIKYSDPWIKTLNKNFNNAYDIIDGMNADWMSQCLSKDYELYLVHPTGSTHLLRKIFEERIQVLVQELHKKIYPSLTEILLHENKKYLADWLEANNIPHPRTAVLMTKDSAVEYLSTEAYPLVYKQNIGSSGKGVKLLKNAWEAERLLRQAYGQGIRPKIGPNLRTASLIRKLQNAVKKKDLLKKRMSYYKAVYNEPQKYLILQEYIPHEYEWRAVVIGDSFFAHKKMVSGSMASGSLVKNYDDPPLELLDFVREISINHDISSTSIDIFETPGGYLINEIQTYFGQSDPYQMKVGGVPGRYRFIDGQWIFEPGDWASNQCYDLRLEHALSMLEQNV